MSQPTKEQFLKDVRNHTMKILEDIKNELTRKNC